MTATADRPTKPQPRDWLERALWNAIRPDLPRHDSLRCHEPDSPESIYLREMAEQRGRVLKDSRAMAERLAEEAAEGLRNEREG